MWMELWSCMHLELWEVHTNMWSLGRQSHIVILISMRGVAKPICMKVIMGFILTHVSFKVDFNMSPFYVTCRARPDAGNWK